MRKLAITMALTGAVLCTASTAASAQDDGVVVDPDSPAGKEYAIPLERERENSASKPDKDDASGGRFGEGISAEGSNRAGSKGAKGSRKGAGASGRDRDEDGASATPASGDSGGSGGGDGSDAATAGGSAGLLTGGILLAVLLIGGAVALMNRRAATE